MFNCAVLNQLIVPFHVSPYTQRITAKRHVKLGVRNPGYLPVPLRMPLLLFRPNADVTFGKESCLNCP